MPLTRPTHSKISPAAAGQSKRPPAALSKPAPVPVTTWTSLNRWAAERHLPAPRLISKTPLVCMSDTDYSDIKADIEKFCNDLPNLCSTDVTEEPNPSQAQMTARQIKFHFKKIERAFNRVRKVRGLSPKKY